MSFKTKELRCKRCKSFYYNCENWETSCTYHPGRYGAIRGGSGLAQSHKWSCCRDLFAETKGCREGYHVEDYEFTQFVSTSCAKSAFSSATLDDIHLPPRKQQPAGPSQPVVRSAAGPTDGEKQNMRSLPMARVSHAELSAEDRELLVEKGYQVHYVQESDSLSRLALAYATTTTAIKRTNQLVTERDMFARPYLLIPSQVKPNLPEVTPPSPESIQKRKVMLFLSSCSCRDPMEAQAYLEECQWDIQQGISKYQADMRWEREQERKEIARSCCV
eukprot:CAMPEP_0119140642 /NCGR_PEP_ID=MMETSP1310-20130426/29604_1 /TAXON_ID=464262 /ORGANISM="Genus nov. species nov., Strain RCC2339" /LENGTH=274 /DNA_ID=CAMNT_0007132011 /DNA_START=140 /DNA_END=964 /DNA_ORIENTATION=-